MPGPDDSNSMEPFSRLVSTAAPLLRDAIDTDIIFPARFLLHMEKQGLGRYLFHDQRFFPEGKERPDFILNRELWRDAKTLIAGRNFGCGSSREHAVWALADFGIRCVIAESFGDIFFANCFQNGLLPIVLSASQIALLNEDAMGGRAFTIDLVLQSVTVAGGNSFDFEIRAMQRQMLLQGWDSTEMILRRDGADIAVFEAVHRTANPWLFEEAAPDVGA